MTITLTESALPSDRDAALAQNGDPCADARERHRLAGPGGGGQPRGHELSVAAGGRASAQGHSQGDGGRPCGDTGPFSAGNHHAGGRFVECLAPLFGKHDRQRDELPALAAIVEMYADS